MLFFKRIIARWVSEAYQADEYDEDRKYPETRSVGNRGSTRKKSIGNLVSSQSEGMEFKNPMNITLYNAVGGKIIKFHRWDDNADETYETTYVVDSGEDFEKALASFIALEAIKHV